jgi:hypothetical protein
MTDESEAFTAAEWTRFCEHLNRTLIDAGAAIMADRSDALDRDEGVRMLLRQLRHSLERDLEERDVTHPVFGPVFTETYHTLADAPDYAAYDALISGEHSYRLVGQLGNADSINFTTLAPRPLVASEATSDANWKPWPGAGGSDKPSAGRLTTGTLDLGELEVDEKRRFEVILSTQRPETGVWLPMTEETNRLVVRNVYHGEYRQHRRQNPARLWLECLGVPPRPPAYTSDDLRRGLTSVLNGVERIPLSRAPIFERIRSAGNGQFSTDDAFWRITGANSRTRFQDAYWALREGEAMVIDLDSVPACDSWSLGLTNAWMESLDFRFFPINLNSTSAQYGDDGSLRIVIADGDRGQSNWLDTGGHRHGAMLWRWNGVQDLPALPRVTLVPIASLIG